MKKVLSLSIAVIGASLNYAALAETATLTDNHSSGEVDTNAPIAALTKLTSLKNPSQLDVKIPKITHFLTDTGTPVAFVATDNLPMVDVSIYFNAGSARDEAIKQGGYGIASMVATMLDQGTTSKTEDQIAQTSEQLGAELSASAYKDMFIVNLRSLSDQRHLSSAIDLMADIISHPTFEIANLDRSKAQYLVALQRAKEDPDSIAAKTFAKALYGNHPYAHPTQGTEESIANLQQADLKAFGKQFLVAKNANIAITGAISEQKAREIANQLTQALSLGTAAPKLPTVSPIAQAKTIHIPFDSTQTTIIMGQLGDARSNQTDILQQQTNFAIANEVVGGGNFQARLMEDIRKKRGLTYGIYSSMTPMLSQGSYTIRFSTRNEKTAEAIDATQTVLKNTIKNGITSNELALTKDSLINSFPTSFASNAAINATLGMMGFYQLPDSYLTDYVSRIQQADLAAVNQSYKNLVDPNKFLIVTVGKGDLKKGK